MIVHRDVKQRTPEWFALRCGKLTASNFHKIIQPERLKPAAGLRAVAADIVAENILGVAIDQGSKAHYDPDVPVLDRGTWMMQRGSELEDEALFAYEMLRGVDVETVGFVEGDDGLIGCSPDAIVFDGEKIEGGAEFKNRGPSGHLAIVLGTETRSTGPTRCQTQGSIWVTGAQWWDIIHYHPNLKSHAERTRPDPAFQAAFSEAYDAFRKAVDELTAVYDAIEGKWAEDDNLKALLMASLVGTTEADQPTDIDALHDLLTRAESAGVLDVSDVATVTEDALAGRWDSVESMVRYCRKSLDMEIVGS